MYIVAFVLYIYCMYKLYSKLLNKLYSFQIHKDWRVVATFAYKTSLKSSDLTLESKLCPLEFDECFHKPMNSELKYLYTTITQAKYNLWIYDSSESPPNLIKEYIQAISISKQVCQIIPKYFKEHSLEGIAVCIFSPRVSLCLPLSKTFACSYKAVKPLVKS